MRHRALPPVVALAVALVTTAALACPDCPTARVVRRSLWVGDFWGLLVTLAVPFLLIGFLSAVLYRIGLDGPGTEP